MRIRELCLVVTAAFLGGLTGVAFLSGAARAEAPAEAGTEGAAPAVEGSAEGEAPAEAKIEIVEDAQDVIRTKGIEIVDDQGKVVGKLGIGPRGTVNLYFDDSGKQEWKAQFGERFTAAHAEKLLKALREDIKRVAELPEVDTTKMKVQHILIGTGARFNGRSLADAEILAADVFSQLQAGGDIGELMEKYSDDPGPGIYGLFADGQQGAQGDSPRSRMVKGFGDTSWKLKVGDVGVAGYSETDSPFGFHIIKRLE